MQIIKEHIIFRVLTVMLALTLFVPSAVKFAHIFEHHTHKICLGGDNTHIHKIDLDCEFNKFNLNNHFLTSINYEGLLETSYFQKAYPLTYKFLNNHRQLSFSLRGPPVLV